jgi:hypothetical protein
MWIGRLSSESRDDILKAYSAGERVVDIAERFGVHHSYPALLARRRDRPTRLNRKNKRYLKEKDHD